MNIVIKLFDSGFKKCFLFLLTSSLLLIWLPRYLPLTDYPEQLLIANILSHYNDPYYGYNQSFTIKIENSPYLIFYIFAKLLSPFFSIELIGKLFLSLYVILTPVSILYYITSLNRDAHWNAILAVPLAFNVFYFGGFLNFIFSVPLVFFALGALIRNFDEGFNLRRSILVALLNVLVFYSHILSLMILIVCEIILLPVKKLQGIEKIFLNLLFILPSFILFTIWWFQTRITPTANVWEPLKLRLLYFLQPFLIYMDWRSSKLIVDTAYLLFIIAVIFVVCWALLKRNTTASMPMKPNLFSLIFFSIFASATLFAPSASPGVTISHRYSIYAAFSVLALLPRSIAKTSLQKLALFTVSLGLIINLSYRAFVFNHEMGAFERLSERIAPRSSVLPLVINMHSSGFKTFPYLHIICYYHLRKGGEGLHMHLLTALHKYFPVRYRNDPNYSIPTEWSGESFDWSLHDHNFDYFMVKGDSPKVLNQLAENARLIFHEADWYLFKRCR